MKEKILMILIAVLIIAIGIQGYMLFHLNERLNHITGQDSQIDFPKFTLPKLPKLNPPKTDDDDGFFKDQPWNPYEEMQHMQDEMEQLFGDSFSRFHMKSPLGSLSKSPDVDLQEKPDRYVVTVNAPGADASSINVKLDDKQLHISIKTEAEKDEDGKDEYRYRERFTGEFHRLLTLPGPANAAKMATEYHNGVLTITIPKA
jgi:HSP20 family protein